MVYDENLKMSCIKIGKFKIMTRVLKVIVSFDVNSYNELEKRNKKSNFFLHKEKRGERCGTLRRHIDFKAKVLKEKLIYMMIQ